MSSDNLQSGQLLSSKDAGKLLGYTHDYISKLCREGKMSGVQKGRIWYVTEDEVHAFKVRHEAELEAKKTQLSQKFSTIRQEHETQRKVLDEQPIPLITKMPRRTFRMPREVLAASVLGLLLLAPSFAGSVISNFTGSHQANSTNISLFPDTSDIMDNLHNGVATVIASQSELANETAKRFSFVQYLNDGYWALASSATELCKGFYSILTTFSDGYIALYEKQGEAIYDSFEQTANMGAFVLTGYELVGESFVKGTKQAISTYSSMLNLKSRAETSKKKLNKYASDTVEGARFAKDEARDTFLVKIASHILNARSVVVDNIATNFLYIGNASRDAASLVSSGVTDLISFDLLKPKDEVRAIEIK